MSVIRPCRDDERPAVLAVINAAAHAYRGVIPTDRRHEPYMPAEALERDVAAGVAFWCLEDDGALLGVMGMQPVRDVDLIRHAYVAPQSQRRGVGGALLARLAGTTGRRLLVGTWAAADWAVAFYRRNGFALLSATETVRALRDYWDIPEAQVVASVVLERRAVGESAR